MRDKSIAGFLSYAASSTVNSVEQYRDVGCDLCAGVPLAPDSQACDHRCSCGRQLACEHHGGTNREAMTADDWRELAVRWSGFALKAIRDGRAGDAAGYAAGTYRYCLKHQLAGGNPWDGGE